MNTKFYQIPHKNRILSFVTIVIGLLLIFTPGCKKKTETPSTETGSMTDQGGNTYKTIKIGNQWWMAENLKVKKFCNGDSISPIQNATQWKSTNGPAYCFYDSASLNAGLLLYNWNVVKDDRKIAPPGWHIPSDDEWKALEMQLGMSQSDANKVNWRGTNEGDKLKLKEGSNSSSGSWIYANNQYSVWPTNESGFSALAGCCRLFTGVFGEPGVGTTGFWWSSTEYNGQAWYRYLDYNKSNIFRFYGDKRYGCSIRCVKD